MRRNYLYPEAGVRSHLPPSGTNESRQTPQLPGSGDSCPCAWCSPSSSGAVLGGDPAFLFGGAR